MERSPLCDAARRRVLAATHQAMRRAERHWRLRLPEVAVHFDLSGSRAGTYQVRTGVRLLRFNPWLFSRHLERCLAEVVPHEVAHLVVDCRWGRGVRPHGPEWQAVMASLGAPARTTHDLPLEGVPVRRERRVPYRCACRIHQLSARRHHWAQRRGARYRCRECGALLEWLR